MEAWRNAWNSTWGPEGYSSQYQSVFMDDVLKSARQDNPSDDPVMTHMLGQEPPALDNFALMVEAAVGVVGLVHDLGHPPFSHVLEEEFLDFADIIFPASFLTKYHRQKNESPGMQLHEYAGGAILEQAFSEKSLWTHISTYLVRQVFFARERSDYPSWATCLHSMIDGQVDVDRLDYIVRDSLRAGTDFHAIDMSRLLRNIELHYTPEEKPPLSRWNIGIGLRGLSAVEGLLSQREQSYRWMIFHSRAIAADTALKRVFRHALQEHQKAGKSQKALNYATNWKASDPRSYAVDDHAVTVWLRGYRQKFKKGTGLDALRLQTLCSVFDELNDDYIPSWRHYGEFVTALARLDTETWDAIHEASPTLKIERRGSTLLVESAQEPAPDADPSSSALERDEARLAAEMNDFLRIFEPGFGISTGRQRSSSTRTTGAFWAWRECGWLPSGFTLSRSRKGTLPFSGTGRAPPSSRTFLRSMLVCWPQTQDALWPGPSSAHSTRFQRISARSCSTRFRACSSKFSLRSSLEISKLTKGAPNDY
ncbi:MAG: hypothetical protein Q4G45_10530 [Actinomycetia bacterium]|nr:hypothetical protein [Actinomycetes bacterium]